MKKIALPFIPLIFLLSCSPALGQVSQQNQPAQQDLTTEPVEKSSNAWMPTIIVGFSGILSGIVSSAVFLAILARLRPKILISDLIAKENGPEGNIIYRVKVVNKTPRRIINVKLELALMTPKLIHPSTQGAGTNHRKTGVNKTLKSINLARSEVPMIEKYNPDDRDGDYACKFRSYEKIEELWDSAKEDSYLVFTVFATDSLSNFTTVERKEYYRLTQDIRTGKFEFGDSTAINESE